MQSSTPATIPPIVHETLTSPGRPLDTATRSFMESRFGHDFSRVRVHVDDRAAKSAQAVQARAYTVGHDIVFGKGEYAPDSIAGRKLLAHELTHVRQQQSRNFWQTGGLQRSSALDPSEQEAESAARAAIAGKSIHVHTQARAGRLQRQETGAGGTAPAAGTLPTRVCGGVDEFFRTILLIDPNIVSDAVTCLCFGAGIADILPIPGVGSNPVVEGVDCACNILTTLQEIYNRGADGGCWDIANLTTPDILLITALAELTIIDCGSLPIGTALGGLIGGLVGGGGGGAAAGPPGAVGGGAAGAGVGAIVGDFIVDVAAMALQNLITQGTPLPAAQYRACERLARRARAAWP